MYRTMTYKIKTPEGLWVQVALPIPEVCTVLERNTFHTKCIFKGSVS